MSLDGLRAWIGEVERKLAMRTRVFLVLLAIAIGGSGAAIYLALEAEEGGGGGASADEVKALQEQVRSLSLAVSQVGTLEAEVNELRAKLQGGGGGAAGGSESSTPPGRLEGETEAKPPLPEGGAGSIPEGEAK